MNERPLGSRVEFHVARAPVPDPLRGGYVVLRPLSPAQDAPPLFAVSHPPQGDPDIWRYLHYGPYADASELERQLAVFATSTDPLFFAVVPVDVGRPQGVVSFLRMEREYGVIEIGHIWFGTGLQRTRAATEAIYLLARQAFDGLGYRRLEWKCNALNAASRRAARRFGFAFEGIFRQHQVVKGRNRDTAWYAITDNRWPQIRSGFETWLEPSNFDAEGNQRQPLRTTR